MSKTFFLLIHLIFSDVQEEEVRFLDPSRHHSGQYTVNVCGDHKLFPKSIKYVIEAVDRTLKNKGPNTGKLEESVEKHGLNIWS